MRKYKVEKRVVKSKKEDGTTYVWTSNNYYLSYYENRKKKVVENLETDNKKVAEEKARKKMEALSGSTLRDLLIGENWLSPTSSPRYVNAKAIDRKYLYGQSERNARYLDIFVKQINDIILDIPYTQINDEDVMNFKTRIQKISTYKDAWGNDRKTTPTLFNRILDALSAIYNYYISWGRSKKITENPFSEKRCGRFKKDEMKEKFVFPADLIQDIFDKETLESITPLSTIKGRGGKEYRLSKKRWLEIIDSVYFSYFKFIAYTGLRISEASALTVGQFDINSGYRVVKIDRAFKSGVSLKKALDPNSPLNPVGTPKNGKTRKIVLCDDAYETVLPFLTGKKPSDYVFTTSKTDHSLVNSLITKKQEAVFRIFIDEIEKYYRIDHEPNTVLSLHGFRTSLNTNLITSNVREILVASYMGWDSKALAKTQKKYYTKNGVNELFLVADAINYMFRREHMNWSPEATRIKKLAWQNIHDSLKKKRDDYKLTCSRFRELAERVCQKVYTGINANDYDKSYLNTLLADTKRIRAIEDNREYTSEMFWGYYTKHKKYLDSDAMFSELCQLIISVWKQP